MISGTSGLTPTPFRPEGLLLDLMAVTLTGINVLSPVYSPTGELENFVLEYLNPAAQRMTGHFEHPPGTLRSLFPGSFTNGVFDFYRRVFETGEADRHQVNYQADGLDNYFHVAARRSGEWLVVNFTDTSEQDRSAVEEALRQSQAREHQARAQAEAQRTELQRVFEQAPIALARLRGPDFVVEWANSRMSQIWGRPLEQIVGRPHFEALPDLAGQGFEAVFAGVLQSGQPHYLRELLVTIEQAQQSYQGYFNITYQPVYDEQGHPAGLMASAIEVTDQVLARRQTEQLNQALEERVLERTREALALQTNLLAAAQHQAAERLAFYHIFEQAPVLVALLRAPRHRFEYVNPAYQALFPGRQLVGLDMIEAVPEMKDQGFVALMDHTYRTGEPYVGQQLPFVAVPAPGQSPRPAYYNFTYQPYRENGHVVGISIFAYDVTEQVLSSQQVQNLNDQLADVNQELAAINEELTATNEELSDSNQQLTRTNVDLDNFIYTASHDLKAPIHNIEGLLLALEHELPAAGRVGEVPYMLTLMQEATERFKRTILHLTEVSRLQQEHSQAPEQVSLAAVLDAVRLDLLPQINQHQAQLEVQVPACLSVTFTQKNLRSVVYNLLSNSLKYRHPDRIPQVVFRYKPEQDYQVLEVQDNGLGMDLSQGEDKLFAMFQRLHTHVEGTGIGLYMVKKIMENAGGRIEVESHLGQGSTFRLYFQR